MANIFAPTGFSHIGRLDGAAPNYAQFWAKISKSNATACYFGDPVTQLSTGYVTQSTPGTTQIKGIAVEFKYLGISPAQMIWQKNWPGSNAQTDVDVAIISDPAALFLVQANGLVTLANVGNNANFGIGTGNPSIGLGVSGAYLDTATIATTSTLPFRIVSLYQGTSGQNGGDPTTSFNLVVVAFNNVDAKSLTGI